MKRIFFRKQYLLFFLFFLFCGPSAFADETPATEPEKIPSGMEMIRLSRTSNTPECLSLKVHYAGLWTLSSGESQKDIDQKNPILRGQEKGPFFIPGDQTERRYFALQTDTGTFTFAENPLPITGGYNFRDMGGIRAKAGKQVLWGMFFRGDSMEKLTEKDLAYLAKIPIRTLVDFRSEEEAEKAPDKVPDSVVKKLELHITPGSLLVAGKEKKTSEEYEKMMLDMYRGMVQDETVIQQYKKFFRLVQNSENLPVLFHCSAGKDRTGLAAALLLAALGVDRFHIMKDYLASNEHLGKKYEGLLTQHPEMAPLFSVKESYLLAAFEEIEKSHESLEYFLRVVLDIDMGKLQKKYLFQAELL